MATPPDARRRAAILAGHRGDEAGARALLADEDAEVRAAALGALARSGAITAGDLERAWRDPSPVVRRRGAQEAAAGPAGPDLVLLLRDADATVVDMAAWALGERGDRAAVTVLAEVATGHPDALCREAAVAALGAIGEEAGLAAILAATSDKPAVRRRAVLALAPFSGPEVDAALQRARRDRDWQVRQAAEDLLEPDQDD